MNTQLKIHHNKEITAVPALSQDELKTTTSVWFNGCPNLADVSELVKIGHRLHHIQLSTCPKIDLDQLILIDVFVQVLRHILFNLLTLIMFSTLFTLH